MTETKNSIRKKDDTNPLARLQLMQTKSYYLVTNSANTSSTLEVFLHTSDIT